MSPWLPRLILLADHNGVWEDYLDAIYSVFQTDFIASKPIFEEKQVKLMKGDLEGGKELTFWHITSEGTTESERIPDMRRCERIGWIKPLIENASSDEVKCWEKRHRRKKRVILALEDFSYVVVLERRKTYCLLWTAFYVEKTHRRKKLEKEYLHFIEACS